MKRRALALLAAATALVPASGFCLAVGQTYDKLAETESAGAGRAAWAKSYDGESYRAYQIPSPGEAYHEDEPPPRKSPTRLDGFKAGAARNWARGMKFVDWYDAHLVKPVDGPLENYLAQEPPPSLFAKIGTYIAKAAAFTADCVYTIPHLCVLLPAFCVSGGMALAGGVAGLLRKPPQADEV